MSLAAQKLRRYRHARTPRMTQEDLGRRYDVTGPAVHLWETGQRTPSPPIIKRMQVDGICEPGDWYAEAEPKAEGEAVPDVAE